MNRLIPCSLIIVGCFCLALASFESQDVDGQEKQKAEPDAKKSIRFKVDIRPLLQKHCFQCHGPEAMESGIRVDRLDGQFEDRNLKLWEVMRKQIAERAMPPEDEPVPTKAERKMLVDWIDVQLRKARLRKRPNHGTIRRLTVSQYRNTLRDLLGIEEDLTTILPPDGVSKDGFRNNGQTMLLSPLLVEAYFSIAEKALDLAIVNEGHKPVVQNFKVELGESINKDPHPEKLILGANSSLLRNQDFVVTELTAKKPFDLTPFEMQRKFRFIEGYRGNDTVRGWREFDSIYHAVFACVRGTPGYPVGEAYQVEPKGLLLRPAIPSSELFGQSSTYGPKANFKISLRELPEHGNFRVTVRAARYNDAIILTPNSDLAAGDTKLTLSAKPKQPFESQELQVNEAGVYQLDATILAGGKPQRLEISIGDRHFASTLRATRQVMLSEMGAEKIKGAVGAFLLVRLPAGKHKFDATYGAPNKLRKIVLTRLETNSALVKRFEKFEQRVPILGVHVGLRRDCGSTLNRVGRPRTVASRELTTFVFEGAINNFPSPDVEKDNVNYLAGVREIGVRSEYTDGREMPRLMIRSVEFEGPYYKSWPPESHRRIFIESENKSDPAKYAKEILSAFATRAFRRPVTDDELNSIFAIWQRSSKAQRSFQDSIKDALLVTLTSPQFLFIIEQSSSADDEELDDMELASKLSYFLWNGPPDQRLLKLAQAGELKKSLDKEVDRMIDDARFQQFVDEFGTQWLSLEKFDVVKIDDKKFPTLTRDTKTQLRREPVETLKYLIRENLSLRHLVQSDRIVANEVVANYYGLGSMTESGFEFVPIKHKRDDLGGLLTQASILSGLSDGHEPNPVKRGAWFARKIVARPPDDPPPNVPQIEEDDGSQLTLRQKLERHRNQKGCAACHSRIDPWGIPFEQFDAGGLLRKGDKFDPQSTLPDGTVVANLNEMKAYLAGDQLERVAFSFAKHIASYATGRSLRYNEIASLEENAIQWKPTDYRARNILRFVIKSDIFLKK